MYNKLDKDRSPWIRKRQLSGMTLLACTAIWQNCYFGHTPGEAITQTWQSAHVWQMCLIFYTHCSPTYARCVQWSIEFLKPVPEITSATGLHVLRYHQMISLLHSLERVLQHSNLKVASDLLERWPLYGLSLLMTIYFSLRSLDKRKGRSIWYFMHHICGT